MGKKVELFPAWEWICPQCDRNNYVSAITMEISPSDPDNQGAWMSVPDDVNCKHCNAEFQTDEDYDHGEEGRSDVPCPNGLSGWQLVVTAPQDGTCIMLRVTDTFTNETSVDVGRWRGRRWLDPRNRQINPDADIEITHWRPLPDTDL